MPVAALFNNKAKKWVRGRKNILNKMELAIPANSLTIWMHCASLGEFEQGRPILEKLKAQYPVYKILLTFFSPSGYEAQKNYKGADWVFYLPLDGSKTAKRFIEIVNPKLAIFVKYEFWFFYLKKIKYRNIPLILVSAVFQKNMSFFKWYGKLQRKMLSRFNHVFVQTQESKNLIDGIGLSAICSVSGDTRFDRVVEIADNFKPLPLIKDFINEKWVIVAGSTWPEDEAALCALLASDYASNIKLIIAPHDISTKRIETIEKVFEGAVRYSQLNEENILTANILIIDNIGMLSKLYHYADICFVGGGFARTGIHNVLEAAVHGKPVLWGANYEKYEEAKGLIAAKGGIAVYNSTELNNVTKELLTSKETRKKINENAKKFVKENTGATQRIIQFIQENRLLTN